MHSYIDHIPCQYEVQKLRKKIERPASAARCCSVPAWGARSQLHSDRAKNISAALSSRPQVGHQLCNFACENEKAESVPGQLFQGCNTLSRSWLIIAEKRIAHPVLGAEHRSTNISLCFTMLPQAHQKHSGARRRWLDRFRQFRLSVAFQYVQSTESTANRRCQWSVSPFRLPSRPIAPQGWVETSPDQVSVSSLQVSIHPNHPEALFKKTANNFQRLPSRNLT